MSTRTSFIEGVYDAWNRGEIDAAVEALDPEIECVLPETGMNTGTYRGRDEVRKFLASYLEVFEFFHFEAQRMEEDGDRVAVQMRVRARGRGSGVEVELRPRHLWGFRGDRAVRLEVEAPTSA